MRPGLIAFAGRYSLQALVLSSAVSILLTSCDTKNVGGGLLWGPNLGPEIESFRVEAEDFASIVSAGSTAFVKVTYSGVPNRGRQPIDVQFDLGGCGEALGDKEKTSSLSFHSPTVSQRIRLADPLLDADYILSVTVTDAAGLSMSRDLTLHLPANPRPPVISNIAFDGRQLSFDADDPSQDPEEELTVSVESAEPGVLVITRSVQHFEAYSAHCIFLIKASDVLGGADCPALIRVESHGGQESTEFSTEPLVIEGLTLPTDGLAAIPLATDATTADTVKVVVATGPMASPFQFMTGVSVVFPLGCAYDANSFDYGAPMPGDGEPPGLNPSAPKDQETVDGIWTVVNPSSGFLGVGDNLLQSDPDLPAPFTGSSAVDFNITPLGGSDAPVGSRGILFNFNLKFTAAGSYKLGFLLFDEINRTYYQDGIQQIHFWSDLTNSSAQDTVTVTE